MAEEIKIDSNVTGLRIAEEVSLGLVDSTAVWEPQEPNTYQDFGGQTTLVPRAPITAGRQRKKGVITDLDASGGYEQDLTQQNSQNLLQGFMFADLRRKADVGLRRSPYGDGLFGENTDYLITAIDGSGETITVDSRVAVSAAIDTAGSGYAVGDIIQVTDANATVTARFVVTSVSTGAVTGLALSHDTGSGIIYGREGRTDTDTGSAAATTAVTGSGDNALEVTVTYANGISWVVGALVYLTGNNASANDGLKRVTSVTNNVITVAEDLTTDASPAATATMTTVGVQATAGDIDVSTAGDLPVLTSSTLDFTTLGLTPGEWIFVGGDLAANQFANAANNGFARVLTIAANALTLDKTAGTMVTESSTTETVRLFFGRVLKNESSSALIKRRTYQAERTLGAPDNSYPSQLQAEYMDKGVANEFQFAIPTADKLVTNLSFVFGQHSVRSAATGLKAGTRPSVQEATAFNTSSDVVRAKMTVVSTSDSNATSLFAYMTELNLTINNGAQPLKAVGVLGGFEVSVGDFVVTGEATVYFANVAAIAAVQNNSDVTLDVHLVKENAGISIDVPLIALGEGRASVEKDQPITLPLSLDAASGAKVNPALDHTLLLVFWDYLPDAADAA